MVQGLNKLEENLRAGTSDCFAGVGAGFHPGKEEQERDPAARILFEHRADDIEAAREMERQADGEGLQGGGIDAVFGRRGDEVFAADERAHGVNGAGFIFEEGTGDALVEVVEGKLVGGLGVSKPVFIDHAVDESGGGEFEESLMEALGELLLAGLGEGLNPGGEGLGLESVDGNQLAAAMGTAKLAGDDLAGLGQLRGDARNQGVIKRLQDGQELGEVGQAGRDDSAGGEFAIADSYSELDSYCFRRVGRLLSHCNRIVAKRRACRQRLLLCGRRAGVGRGGRRCAGFGWGDEDEAFADEGEALLGELGLEELVFGA